MTLAVPSDSGFSNKCIGQFRFSKAQREHCSCCFGANYRIENCDNQVPPKLFLLTLYLLTTIPSTHWAIRPFRLLPLSLFRTALWCCIFPLFSLFFLSLVSFRPPLCILNRDSNPSRRNYVWWSYRMPYASLARRNKTQSGDRTPRGVSSQSC